MIMGQGKVWDLLAEFTAVIPKELLLNLICMSVEKILENILVSFILKHPVLATKPREHLQDIDMYCVAL